MRVLVWIVEETWQATVTAAADHAPCAVLLVWPGAPPDEQPRYETDRARVSR